MATLYITEYERQAPGGVPIALTPEITSQTVAIGGSTTQSAAFGATTSFIRVHCDAICSIAIAANPTATATKSRLAADQTEYFAVRGGDKLAVITNT
jgi:hypothetical protein